jgi:DNA (cytosine-5)-methyltransferase 1
VVVVHGIRPPETADNVFVDLYCGAGGTTTGAVLAALKAKMRFNYVAVNHNVYAIATHSDNHPEAEHYCQDVQHVEPLHAVPGGYIFLLWASLECTHHSLARGGKPMNDQSRSSAWDLLRWCRAVYVETIMIENVPEFRSWGELYPDDYEVVSLRNRPIPERKGKLFDKFIADLRTLGYTVDYRILNAADFGDPTSRKRLFIQCQKNKPIVWPMRTHGTPERPHRTAREIIDWSKQGRSIFERGKPLVPNSLRRILAGLEKFGHPALRPWIESVRSNLGNGMFERPVLEICHVHGLVGVADPFLIGIGGPSGAAEPQSVDQPLGTVLGQNHRALCEPFITPYYGNSKAVSVEEPLGTITTMNKLELCVPFLVPNFGERAGQGPRTHSVDQPLPTVTGHGAGALVQPFLVEYHGGPKGDKRSRSVDEPVPTLDTSNRFALLQPFITPYYGNSSAVSVDEPLDTVTGKARFGLCCPEVCQGAGRYYLDIRFRMLFPSELAAAMSFPPQYRFYGGSERSVKQIGNAVPVSLAMNLCLAIMTGKDIADMPGLLPNRDERMWGLEGHLHGEN